MTTPDARTLEDVIAAHFPNVVVEPNGAIRAKCEGRDCDWFLLRDTPRTYRNWRVVMRVHNAHVAEQVREHLAREVNELEPTWPRGMYGCPDDMFTRRDLRAALAATLGGVR